MLPLLFLFSLISNASSLFVDCNNIDSREMCLNRNLCKWCNITVNNTVERECKYASGYAIENNSECEYSHNYEKIITMINIIINLIFIIVFFVMLTYIVTISEMILNKYFASSTNNDENRNKEKSLLVTIISFTVFLPAILLLIYDFGTFILYFMMMLILTIIISCSINTNKLISNSEKSPYSSIN